jgi:hypothetical protein
MKKLTLTIAIVLGMAYGAMAQMGGGGLFERGIVSDEEFYGAQTGYFSTLRGSSGTLMPGLPGHNSGNHENAPVGSGMALLIGLGGAYLVAKKRKED